MAIQKTRATGVREIARMLGYSAGHVCLIRNGKRKSRTFSRKMKEHGLRFKPVK